MCVDMCVHVRLGAGVGVYVCYIGASFPDHRPRVKRSRGLARGYGGYGGVTHAHTDRPVAHHGRPPTGELRRQGPTGPSSALSPVPLALGPPPPIPLRQLANWPAATRQPNSPPNSPPTLPQLPPPGRGQSPPGPGPGPRPVCQRVGFRARQSDESNEPWQTWTRLDSTRTRLNPCPCDTLPPPP